MTETVDVPVNATQMSFTVVSALQELGETGAAELSNHLDIPKSTVHDHLKTLEALELVINENGQYRIGTRFLEFGGHARQQMKIYSVARPEIRSLAERTGEHSNLMIEEHGRGVFLYKAEGSNAVRLDTYNGYRVPLQTTALGKAILAHIPKARVRDIIDRHGMPQVTDSTIVGENELFAELAQIREQGYAIDHEERVRGMRCVAAPLLRNGDVLGAISVSGPTSRMQGDRLNEEIPDCVLSTANVIEVNMTYS
ncbi:IclR family transcriptional regulator [Halocatena halophila]|uniref:IclR family transcriptional regulator n=1 Tax=Halocatena halophila TaxID=2814576 RepID=UPI002ED4A46D